MFIVEPRIQTFPLELDVIVNFIIGILVSYDIIAGTQHSYQGFCFFLFAPLGVVVDVASTSVSVSARNSLKLGKLQFATLAGR